MPSQANRPAGSRVATCSPLPPGERSGERVRPAPDAPPSTPTRPFAPPPGTEPDAATWAQRTEAAAKALAQHPWLRDYRAAPDSAAERPTFLNNLIHSDSPYLLQHAFNPIDWRSLTDPGSDSDRLRLVSIGYSTCYWCHRMAEEAFSDRSVGELLNTRFHAIKIDREQHPEIDARYIRLQRLAGGEVGWPVTVIESAQGEPLFVGSYLERDALLSLLQRLDRMRERAPSALAAMASGLRALEAARPAPPSSGALAERLPPTSLEDFLNDGWDGLHGGRAGAQKFPEPGLLDWLLARALSEGFDSPAAAALALQLDRMATGGLFDPLHGGFFRYATRSDWGHPHFEKMLYTQAQLLDVYARAGQHWNRPAWLAIAAATRRFTDHWLRQPDGLYASAVDARFEDVEGGFYLRATAEAAQVRARHPMLDADPLEAGIQLRLHRDALARPRLDDELRALQDTPAPPDNRPFIDGKTLTGWNARLASALLSAAEAGLDPRAETDAQRILSALWPRFEAASGRIARDQSGRVDGGLEDYARFAQALLDLHARTLEPALLERSAQLLQAAVQRYLGNEPSRLDALARDGEQSAPLGALCLALQAQLSRRFDERWQSAASRCAEALAALPLDSAGDDWTAQRVIHLPESHGPPPIVFFAEGAGRARMLATPGADGSRVQIDLQPGWHINAAEPGNPRLIATRLMALSAGGESLDVRYPQGAETLLSVFDEPQRLYAERVVLEISGEAVSATLRIQACNDRVCLLPEQLRLWR
ncbi:thioredoxin domain-containing protein [Pseudomarimonas salicorniae]|uniref:DUF255 domain-containing protein n=1 Tax=Pseudomarimonas salicorniae TaxID=2933270 RepID=A0ABT0GIV7_9GAMM|nr:DUF255 domain-containing protein [Lysobacter sp. CAU 1642]MCK7594473.1 DUF255 domain-containing protein [Lysobacter sp. CAU 1642]